MHWIWLIIVGAVVGILGRFLHPGRDPMGWLLTIAIGIAALVISGAIFSNTVLEFVVGVIVAALIVALIGRFLPDSRRGFAGRRI
jgi:uncharacterized membrane protein YeaQ/YmgE (transglycosylase-associated protein family)